MAKEKLNTAQLVLYHKAIDCFNEAVNLITSPEVRLDHNRISHEIYEEPKLVKSVITELMSQAGEFLRSARDITLYPGEKP